MSSKVYLLFLASLFVSSCAFAKAFPQEIEQTSSSTDFNVDDSLSTSPIPTNVLVDSNNNNNNNNGSGDQSSTSEGEGNFVLDGNDQSGSSTTPIPLLNTATEIRQYLVNKLREIDSKLRGLKSKDELEQATLLDFDHLPAFEDPLHVGNFTKKYSLADVSFTNVQVRGMHNFRSADVHTDPKDRSVDLHMVAPTLRISGNYFLTNIFRKTYGSFVVKLVDNVVYHEASVYCRLKQEVDIAASHCGIRYGKSINDYANLGFFTQIFRGAISNPMIDQVLQKVGREIGHKMRPVLLGKLRQTVIGDNKSAVAVLPGLETLVRSTVSEARNLMMKDEYRNVELDGLATEVQYETYNGTVQNIKLNNINTFEISELETSILDNKIVVDLTVHDTNVEGSAEVMFVENNVIKPKISAPVNVTLPFEIEDLRVDITFDREIPSDGSPEQRFAIANLNVIISKIVTKPKTTRVYGSEIEVALRDFLPIQLQSVISDRLRGLVIFEIKRIIDESALEQRPTNS